MKKLLALFYAVVISASFAFGAANVDEKLLQDFRNNFPNAQEVRWKESPDTYTVSFVEQDIRTSITYTKDGSFVQSTRYYLEQHLPYYLLANLKKKFAGNKILVITETATAAEILYYINMEDAKTLRIVRMDSDGDLLQLQKFKKAPQE